MDQQPLAPEEIEARIIDERLSRLERPSRIRGWDVEFGSDWQGYPAVFIWLKLDRDVGPSLAEMAPLSDFSRRASDELFKPGLTRWPYISFRVPDQPKQTKRRRRH